VEVSADYAAGFDGDYAPRQGQLRYGPNIGIAAYTADAWDEGLVNGYDGTQWAWNLDAFDAAGVKIINNESYYRFNGVAGFDNLTREKWYRMGIVVDLDPASPTYRQIMQLKSQDITAGVTTIMNNPVGPLGELMYMEGGTAGTTLPDDLGFYNVGRGSLSMFDNAYVGAPYDWQVMQDVPFAITAIDYDPDADTVTLTWRSRPGKTYGAFSTLDLSDWSNELADSLGINEDENPDDGNHITVTFPLSDGLEDATDLFLRIQEE
jgi:hypothetical protein